MYNLYAIRDRRLFLPAYKTEVMKCYCSIMHCIRCSRGDARQACRHAAAALQPMLGRLIRCSSNPRGSVPNSAKVRYHSKTPGETEAKKTHIIAHDQQPLGWPPPAQEQHLLQKARPCCDTAPPARANTTLLAAQTPPIRPRTAQEPQGTAATAPIPHAAREAARTRGACGVPRKHYSCSRPPRHLATGA